ncbi:MAG: hypothetical protein EB120_06100 [Proteobacteria bacterium]|nr:hypothetical protein [Pseudomonadota bacterium]
MAGSLTTRVTLSLQITSFEEKLTTDGNPTMGLQLYAHIFDQSPEPLYGRRLEHTMQIIIAYTSRYTSTEEKGKFLAELLWENRPIRLVLPNGSVHLYSIIEGLMALGKIETTVALLTYAYDHAIFKNDAEGHSKAIASSEIEKAVYSFLETPYTLEEPEFVQSALQKCCDYMQKRLESPIPMQSARVIHEIAHAMGKYFFSHLDNPDLFESIKTLLTYLPILHCQTFEASLSSKAETLGTSQINNLTWLTGAILKNQAQIVQFLIGEHSHLSGDKNNFFITSLKDDLNSFYKITPVSFVDEHNCIRELSPLYLAYLTNPGLFSLLKEAEFTLSEPELADLTFTEITARGYAELFPNDLPLILARMFPTYEGLLFTQPSYSALIQTNPHGKNDIESLQEKYETLNPQEKKLLEKEAALKSDLKTLNIEIHELSHRIARDSQTILELPSQINQEKTTLLKSATEMSNRAKTYIPTEAERLALEIESHIRVAQQKIAEMEKEFSSDQSKPTPTKDPNQNSSHGGEYPGNLP